VLVNFIQKYKGMAILTIISLMPIALWLYDSGGTGQTNESIGNFISALGKATALSGIGLFAVMPILSMRHKLLEQSLGGLDKVYKLHKSSGKISIYLIIMHPILLGIGRMLNGKNITNLWDWSSFLIFSGLLALATTIFVTVISIFAHIKHQNWIWVHRLFGWLIPLFFIHAVVARSQFFNGFWLPIYLTPLLILGFLAFLYRSVFHRYFVKQYKYKVSEINNFSETVSEIVLKPLGVPITYMPGQFAYLAFDSEGIDREAHPYSFSNANNGPYVRFTIKALGDDTKDIRNLKTGDKAYLEGPYGKFSYKHIKNTKQVWIAGGIGITPFLSMARSFSGRKKL
jgi:predicted ferric reductase